VLVKFNRFRSTIVRVLLLLTLILPSFSARAADQAATEQVTARLVAGADAVHPSGEILLGLQQRIIPHWHTYWVNPGDSGSSTTIDWQLPPGANASEILWPAPERISMGPITNYGYENEVTLLSRISVPDDLRPGDTFVARAVVDWLVCEEECIPQQVELDLSLPVVAPGESLGSGSPLISAAVARLPVENPWPVRVSMDAEQLTLLLEIPEDAASRLADVWFYPDTWGRIRQSDAQRPSISSGGLSLSLLPGEAPVAVGETLTGVLVVKEEGGAARGFIVNAPVEAGAPAQQTDPKTGLLAALLLALAGGVILNLMPCVFPVLSLKALALIGHAGQSQAQIRWHGAVYTLGVLASFAALALVLIILKAGGAQIGWGFQFQSPLFVLLVAYLMFAVGLSLSGVFYVGGSVAGAGASLAAKPGYAGSFFTGILATVVATPCTAPFMAVALGYALAQPPGQLLAVFLSLGLGLALPFLALSCWPGLQRWLPRPGVWMERVKQAMAFPMYAAAVWLVWVLARQAGADAAALALGGMVLIAFAAWLYGTTRSGSPTTFKIGSIGAAVALALALGGGYSAAQLAVPASTATAQHNWQPYSDAQLQKLLDEDKPVFLNFTAAWCISCLVNERVALSDAQVMEAFADGGITYLKGDWTNRDPAITGFLARFGRSGVPLYLFYPSGRSTEPVQLPQILTPGIVLTVIQSQAASDPTSLSSTAFDSGRK